MPGPSRVVTLRYRVYDHELGCERTGIYGYRAVCHCGWRGDQRDARGLAAAELHWHMVDRHAELDEVAEGP